MLGLSPEFVRGWFAFWSSWPVVTLSQIVAVLIWLLLSLFTISLTGMATAISLNFSLVNDLLRNPEDSGKAMSILIVGGNTFGVAAPIITGHVIQATGSYNWAFGIAGMLLVTGATILLTMTRSPIEIPAPAVIAAR